MNHNQRGRLEKLEADTAARRVREQPAVDLFAEIEASIRIEADFLAGGAYLPIIAVRLAKDPVERAKKRRTMRICDRHRLERFGHLERAAAVPIDPASTADELRSEDGLVDALYQGAPAHPLREGWNRSPFLRMAR